jgi:hypothetical protein
MGGFKCEAQHRGNGEVQRQRMCGRKGGLHRNVRSSRYRFQPAARVDRKIFDLYAKLHASSVWRFLIAKEYREMFRARTTPLAK